MLRVVVSVLFLVISAWSAALCKTSAPATLTGTVSSDAEGRMEGVVVSAKQAGGTITVSVVTDKKGLYVLVVPQPVKPRPTKPIYETAYPHCGLLNAGWEVKKP